MNLNCIKAIVFDLEGTLLDRVKSREKFIEEQYERFHDYFIHVQLADYKNKFIELDDDEDNDKPDLYKEIIKQFHIDRLKWSGFDKINAVKNTRIETVDGDEVSRPGPRIDEGLKDLRDDIYKK